MNWKQYFGKGAEFNVHWVCCLVIVTQVPNLRLKSAASAQSFHPSFKVGMRVHWGRPIQTDRRICLPWGMVKNYGGAVELLFLGICFLLPWKKANIKGTSAKKIIKAVKRRDQYRHRLQLELQTWAQGGPAKTSRPGVCKRAESGCVVEACA